MAASSGAKASSIAVRRLCRDLDSLRASENPQIAVQPSEENLLEWHFVLHALPADTPYHGGFYHGRIVFPPEYPHAPPAIFMVTPSGRLEVGKRLCLSMTDFHPESWNPAWSVETILVGLLSFFISDVEKGFGAISMSADRRRQLAAESISANDRNQVFRALFGDLLAARQVESVGDVSASHAPQGQGHPEAGVVAHVRASNVAVQPGEQTPMETEPEDASLAQSQEAVADGSHPLNSGDASDGAPQECWICRDPDISEQLIQPCACRGSMSGVHASCVEQWIRHHRQNAVSDVVPRCSVCHQPYCGSEVRPGAMRYVGHLCADGWKVVIRATLFVLVIVGFFFGAASPDEASTLAIPVWVRVVLVTVFAVWFLRKLCVLSVSLPLAQQAPANQYLRRFFTADIKQIALHSYEVTFSVTMVCVWWFTGQISLAFALPVACAALIPVLKVLSARHPSLACLWNVGKCLLITLLTPIIIPCAIVKLVWMHSHPLDGGFHLVVCVAVIPMSLLCASNLPLIVLWGAHSTLMVAALVERLLVKRLQWKQGVCWGLVVQMALLAFYTTCLCDFSHGVGEGEDDTEPTGYSLVAYGCSAIWLLLVISLSLSINWTLTVSQYRSRYRTWQNRHGSFRLQASPGAEGPLVAAEQV